jgi:hypothetical protein
MLCGAEMRVMEVVPDDTLEVPGYEHHTLQCTACNDVEQRLVFSRERAWRASEEAEAVAEAPVEPVDSQATAEARVAEPVGAPVAERVAAPSAWKRAVAMFLGRHADGG